MNDIIGQPLAIGDVVAFPNGSGSANSLRLGQILRMGAKMAILTVVQDPQVVTVVNIAATSRTS